MKSKMALLIIVVFSMTVFAQTYAISNDSILEDKDYSQVQYVYITNTGKNIIEKTVDILQKAKLKYLKQRLLEEVILLAVFANHENIQFLQKV